MNIDPDLQKYFPPARFGILRAATPVTTGLSGSRVYAATTDTGEFILRIHGAGSKTFIQTLAAERAAAEHGLAPAIVHVDERTNAVVSVKISGILFGKAMAQPHLKSCVITRLVDCLARLHAIPATNLPATDMAALGQSIWDQQTRRNGFPVWAIPLRSSIAAGRAVFTGDQRRVFSHNDVSPANLLWDGSRVWMIDWELAAHSHPYLDLATFSNFANLSDEDAVELLARQEQAVIVENDRTSFLVLRNFSRAVYAAVFLGLIPDLAQMEFGGLDATPTLSECYRRIENGELDHRTPAGQAQLGAALLRQASI